MMESESETPMLGGRLIRGAVAAAVIAATVALVLIIRARDDDDPSASGKPVAYDETVYTLCDDQAGPPLASTEPPLVGEPAPDFALCDEDGAFVRRLSDMKGSVVWLNFWATWCVPCKRELPAIQALFDEKRADGLEVLVINYQEPRNRAVAFLNDLAISIPMVVDRGGAIYERYRLTGLPDSFFIGRDGNMAALYYGYLNDEIARERLATAGLP